MGSNRLVRNLTKPLISVIIIAHNRTEFVEEAILSVLHQRYDKEKYEIVLVKDFFKDSVDKLCDSSGIIKFECSSKSIGAMMAAGIKNSKGRVIAFLDDDDTFSPDKLSVLETVFVSDRNVAYYHNSHNLMNDKGIFTGRPLYRTLKSKLCIEHINLNLSALLGLFKFGPDFNSSSIAISREIADSCIDLLGELEIMPDSYFFYKSLSTNGKIILDDRILTNYRVHPSISNFVGDFNAFVTKFSVLANEYQQAFDQIIANLGEGISKKCAICKKVEWDIHSLALSKRIIKGDVLKKMLLFLKCNKVSIGSYKIMLIILAIAAVISPILSSSIYYVLKTGSIGKIL